ncbi:MAG: hypothetical protein U1E66_13910 [Rhodospirillales bacterium]
MRVKHVAGLLLAALILTNTASAATMAQAARPGAAPADIAAGPVRSVAATVPRTAPLVAQATPHVVSPGFADTHLRGGPDDEGQAVFWVLIIAGIAVAIVIVVFVVRHRRIGRAG